MSKLYVLFTFVDIAFMIFAFVDVLLTQTWRVRGVPKFVWVVIVLLLAPLGGILWFLIGKEPLAQQTTEPTQRREIHPDDDPDFLARMRVRDEQDERIRQLEQELADLDDDQPDSSDPRGK